MPVGTSLARSDEKVRQVEEIVATFPEVQNVSTTVGGRARACGRAQPGLAEHRPDRAAASASAARRKSRTRSASRSRKIPGIDVSVGFTGRSTSPCSAATRACLAESRSDFARRSRRSPASPTSRLSVKPGLPAYAVRAQARRGARARPHRAAARGEPARLRQRRRRHLLDLARRRAGRRASCACPRRSARSVAQLRQPAGRLRQGRHADRARRAWPTSCRSSTRW